MKNCGLLFYTVIISTSTVNKPSPVKVVHAEEGQNIKVKCPLEYLGSPPRFQPMMHLKTEQGSTIILDHKHYAEKERFSLKYGEKFLTVGIANVSKADAGRYICGVDGHSVNTISMFEIVVTESNRQEKLLLPLLIPALLLLLLTGGGFLALMCYKKRKPNHERGGDFREVETISLRKAVFPSDPQSADTSKDTWVGVYENLPSPVQRPADPIYQNLPLDTRDNQIYSTIDSPKLYKTVC